MAVLAFAWYVLWGIDMWLNGMRRPQTTSAALFMAAACFGLALVSFGQLFGTKLRALVLRPTAQLFDAKTGLVGVGFSAIVLAVWSLLGALFEKSN